MDCVLLPGIQTRTSGSAAGTQHHNQGPQFGLTSSLYAIQRTFSIFFLSATAARPPHLPSSALLGCSSPVVELCLISSPSLQCFSASVLPPPWCSCPQLWGTAGRWLTGSLSGSSSSRIRTFQSLSPTMFCYEDNLIPLQFMKYMVMMMMMKRVVMMWRNIWQKIFLLEGASRLLSLILRDESWWEVLLCRQVSGRHCNHTSSSFLTFLRLFLLYHIYWAKTKSWRLLWMFLLWTSFACFPDVDMRTTGQWVCLHFWSLLYLNCCKLLGLFALLTTHFWLCIVFPIYFHLYSEFCSVTM